MVIATIIAVLEMSPLFAMASFGQLLSQRSGVYNLGIEGIMASGAVFGVLGAYLGLNSWLSLLLGFTVGVLFGALLSLLSVRFKLNQIVVGLGLWLLGLGLAGSLFTAALAPKEIVVKPFNAVLFSLDPIFYLSIGLFVFLLFFFSMMRHGLMIVAVGVNPRAAESAGINVEKVRTLCNTLGSGLIGLAGAYLAVDILQGFTYTLVAGYGWIAFALVIFGRWKVHYVYLGSLLFTATTALATRAAILGFEILPLNYVVILPHISVLVALTLAMIWSKESGMPSALGQPYTK